MGVGLSSTNGKTCRVGDLTEAEVESILEGDDRRLGARQLREARAQLAARLGSDGRGGRIAIDRRSIIGDELLRASREPRLREVLARVDDKPVQPGCELRIAAELAESNDELRERILACVARILGVAQKVERDALHARLVSYTQRFERCAIAILRPSRKNRVGETLEIESGEVGRVT
jgi:hypothetical protein